MGLFGVSKLSVGTVFKIILNFIFERIYRKGHFQVVPSQPRIESPQKVFVDVSISEFLSVYRFSKLH